MFHLQLASPPTRPPSRRPTYMSAESSELLWETNQQFPETSSASSSATTTSTLSSSATVKIAESSSATLLCQEDSLLLDDWNETQEYSDTEQVPEAARLLMEARMAAPQGGLDASSASHSWEHPARVEKRKRVYSYEWVQRAPREPPVGMILLMKLRPLTLKIGAILMTISSAKPFAYWERYKRPWTPLIRAPEDPANRPVGRSTRAQEDEGPSKRARKKG